MNVLTKSSLFFQDAHEFLNQVLDQLKEEVSKVNGSATNPDQVDRTIHEQLLNPTTINFEFEIVHTITCQNDKCNVQKTKTEQFNDLSVDMPRKFK